MKHRILIAALASYLLTHPLPTFAAPPLINYQGRIVVGTTNFNSPPNGLFKFALVNADGTVRYWDNAGGLAGPPTEPTLAVSLPVTKGLYSVLLGDTSIPNMIPIPTSAFTAPDLRLRVWFSDGTNGFQQLTPDQRLAPTAYLADGVVSSANIADASITSSKVAAGAITGTQIANGTLDATRLATVGSPASGQILSFNGTGLNWITPGGGTPTSGWALGGNGGTNAANFLGTTDNQNLIFKTTNLERLRLTTGGELILQKPDSFPAFSVRNGLGVYGVSSAFDEVGRPFASVNILGPVLYGQAGGGLGVKSSTNQETLALRWNNSGVTVTGNLTMSGSASISGGATVTGNLTTGGDVTYASKLGKLDTTEQFTATVRAADFYLGYSTRRGTPGRALVDDKDPNNPAGPRILAVNYASDWDETHIGGLVTQVRTLRISGGADLAEPFQMKEDRLETGSVVVIDDEHPGRLKRSTGAYDIRVAGIVSGANGVNPGIALHQEGVLEGGQNVALSGRVYVQADASGAPIKPGDLLTTSDTPGHAMKVTNPAKAQGAIIGKAMSSLTEGTGLVLVLVTLQ